MSQTAEEWFRTRRKFDVEDFSLAEIWPPLLYAIDVSCGRWPRSIAIRRALERLGRVAVTGLTGWQQVVEISKLIIYAYQIAYQELALPQSEAETMREQIHSALDMIWDLPDDWRPEIVSAEPTESNVATETSSESGGAEVEQTVEQTAEKVGDTVEVMTESKSQ